MTRTHIVAVTGLAVAALALAGCGGGSNNEAATTTTTETTGTGTSTATKLIGTVGTDANADAFSITLTTEDGTAVTTLPAGAYTLEIKDLSTIHNFHLTGPGGVDVSSEVGSTEDKDYAITLEAGSYHYQCDPHSSSMNGDFEVTA